jgi:hypothetical protein
MLSITPAHGQTPDTGALAEVPAPLRAGLIARMNLLFEYNRGEQWENLYDLLYEPTQSREQYVEQNKRFSQQFGSDPILEFTPQSAMLLYPESGWWYIKGCAKQRKGGSILQLEADVQARLRGGEWYFSGFGVSIPTDGKPKPCATPQSATQQNGRTVTPSSSTCPRRSAARRRG